MLRTGSWNPPAGSSPSDCACNPRPAIPALIRHEWLSARQPDGGSGKGHKPGTCVLRRRQHPCAAVGCHAI
eukprot:4019759-Alexandrium_andersonii.AAC.1